MRPFCKYTLVACCCLPGLMLYAQRKHVPAPPPATVQATADKQRIFIGEPIRVLLEATVPDNVPFAWPAIDSLPHFERLDSGRIDTIVRPGERNYRQYLTVTSWDSGYWSIPRIAFVAAGKKVFSDSIRIAVDYTRTDPSKDFHDIKDIIEVPNPFARYIGWIVAGCTLVALVLVVWLIRKKKLLQKWVPGVVVRLSPYEEALQQLAELERQRLPETGKVKVHYSRLGEILREYLLRRLGIASFAETSEELIGEIRRYQLLPAVIYEALAEALRIGDFVKFAKYQPGIADSQHHFEAVRAAIESIEQRERAEEERRRTDGQGQQETKPIIQQTN